jgi:hypothetical protein
MKYGMTIDRSLTDTNVCKQKKCKRINYVKNLQFYLKCVFNVRVKNVCSNKAFIN